MTELRGKLSRPGQRGRGIRVLKGVLAGLMMVAAAPAARAQSALPPDIVILAEPTLRPLLRDLDRLWRQRYPGALDLFTAATAADLKESHYGARADVIFGVGRDAARQAVADGLVKSDQLIGFWRDPMLLAAKSARASGAASDQTPAGLIAGQRVATIEGSLAPQGLAALGLQDATLARHVSAPDSDDASYLLASDAVGLATLPATDVTARHFTPLAALPDQVAPALVVWAGESSQSRSVEMAHFAQFLQTAEVRHMLTEHGLEAITP